MLDWAVIADDLTGAADTGVQFLPVCAPVFLVDHRRLDAVALRAAAPAALAVFTNSRALPAGDARRAAAAAGRAIRRLGPARVYKKIDSALRGNIGTELEGVMEALELPLSFIALSDWTQPVWQESFRNFSVSESRLSPGNYLLPTSNKN